MCRIFTTFIHNLFCGFLNNRSFNLNAFTNHPTISAKPLCFRVFRPPRSTVRPSVRPFVRSSGQILLPRYLVNGLRSLDETYQEYSTALTDDLIRFWRSKVKVVADRWGGEGIHVDTSRSPSSSSPRESEGGMFTGVGLCVCLSVCLWPR